MTALIKLSVPQEVEYRAARQVLEKKKGIEVTINLSYYENLSLAKNS